MTYWNVKFSVYSWYKAPAVRICERSVAGHVGTEGLGSSRMRPHRCQRNEEDALPRHPWLLPRDEPRVQSRVLPSRVNVTNRCSQLRHGVHEWIRCGQPHCEPDDRDHARQDGIRRLHIHMRMTFDHFLLFVQMRRGEDSVYKNEMSLKFYTKGTVWKFVMTIELLHCESSPLSMDFALSLF